MATAIEDNFVDWAKSALADKKSVPRGGKSRHCGVCLYEALSDHGCISNV